MGSRLSPVLAGIYMEHLEETALALCPITHILYKRYVDDIFILWDTRYGPYTLLLDIMNNLNENIVLSAEEEDKGALAFLDLYMVLTLYRCLGRRHMPIDTSIIVPAIRSR